MLRNVSIITMNKEELINWLLENQVVIKELMKSVDSRVIAAEGLFYLFGVELNDAKLHEYKKAIADEISKNKAVHADNLYSNIEDKELEEFLGRI